MELLCPWEAPQYLFFSSNVPYLIFYSHIPALFISLLLGIFILWKSWPSKIGVSLFFINLLFATWTIFDLVIWATNRPDVVLFFWSLQILIEPLLYLTAFYLSYLFIRDKNSMSFKGILGMFLLYLPVVLLISSKYTLPGISLEDCNAVEGFIAKNYTYIVELLCTLGIIILVLIKNRQSSDLKQKKEAIIFGLGIMLFLIAFSWGNILGSFSINWTLAQAGLIGMPIFAGFLAYSIVRFKTFNIKMIATQALVMGVVILVGAQFAFIKTPINRVLNGVTFVGVIIAGIFLVRSVNREVKQREHLEVMTKELESANVKLQVADRMKSQFLSFASHQVKSPMTVVKDYADLIQDGSYGIVPEKVKETAQKIHDSADRLIELVNNLLDLRKLEEGKIEYNFKDIEFDTLVKSVYEELKTISDEKGLKMTLEVPGERVMLHGDSEKLRQTILNLIDNSIKYTEKGWIKIQLEVSGNKCLLRVSDSGLGIPKDLLPSLFEQFNRGSKEAKKIQGTGLGLYIAKQFVLKHGGKIWADSQGPGFGSVFTVELDVLNS